MAFPNGQDNPPGGVAAAPFVKGESFTAPRAGERGTEVYRVVREPGEFRHYILQFSIGSRFVTYNPRTGLSRCCTREA